MKNDGGRKVRRVRKALIRLEDVGPGGMYETEESLWKLRVIADYLAEEQVPFHVAMIPRFVDPRKGYDKSVADRQHDPYVQKFCETMEYLQARGASLGMHGYRHQYERLPSAEGFEFYYADCKEDCVPDDPEEAFLERETFARSYVSERMRAGLLAIERSGLLVDWFETPHYTAEGVQRWELESWFGLFFENEPRTPERREVRVLDVDTPLYRGVVYVPTPLYYVDGSKPETEVQRMIEEIRGFGSEEVAGFFYHPYLEFPFIKKEIAFGQERVVYEERSYLRQLVRAFQEQKFEFVEVLRLVPFVPSARLSDFFPGERYTVLTGDVDGDGLSELLIRDKETGRWWMAKGDLDAYPSRQCGEWKVTLLLDNWVCGEEWQPFVADYNGDGKADVALWHRGRGEWRFASSDGARLHPQETVWQGGAVGERWQPLVGDFDGDGCAEVALWDAEGKVCYRWLDGEWQPCLQGGSLVGDAVPLVGDFDGDGKDDVVFRLASGTWVVAYSDGRQFVLETSLPFAPPLLTGWAPRPAWHVLVGDCNGDGKDDLVAVDSVHGEWQVAMRAEDGRQFEVSQVRLYPWAAGERTEPLVGYFTRDGRTGIAVRQRELRGGVIDFAVSVLGRKR